ncbi:hypothetical protein SPFM8_00135 [Salmonella phage SPFM8]|nr:hypothetical protein SPFM8_00135 [Salmonella phage SPFM8]
MDNLQRIQHVPGATVHCQEFDPERKLGLTRGWAAAIKWSNSSIFGNGSLVAGRGANRLIYGISSWFPEKKKVMSLDAQWDGKLHDASPYTADSEYYRMRLLRGLTLDSESPVMTLGHGDLPDVDQAGEFTWLGDRRDAIYNAGLLYGVAGPGPEGDGKILYLFSGLRVNGNTLYRFVALSGYDPTVKPGLMKFQLAYYGYVAYGELPSAGDYPPGLIQNRRGIGIVAPQYGDDRFYYMTTVTVGSRTLFSPQKSITFTNGETEYTDRTAILGTTYVKLYRDTKPLVRTALPEPLAEVTTMAFTIRWTNNNPGASTAQPSKITLGDTNGELDGFQYAVTGMASVKIRPIILTTDQISDSPRPLLAATDNDERAYSVLVFNTDNTESATPAWLREASNESLRVVPITETSAAANPRPDEGAELTWAPSVVTLTDIDHSGFWPILEMFDVANEPVPLIQAYYQSISASYRSNTYIYTSSTTDANFLDYVWLRHQFGADILSLTSKLGSVNVYGEWGTLPYYTENAAAPDWSKPPSITSQLKYMVKRDDEGTHYFRMSIFDSGDAGPRPKSTYTPVDVDVPTRAICNVTWADLYNKGAIWPNRYAIKWLKFFLNGAVVLSAEELFTSDEMVYALYNGTTGPGPKGLMAGNELYGFFGLVYTGSCKMTYVYEPIAMYPKSLMKYATPETVTLTAHANSLWFNELNGLNLTASDITSPNVAGPKMASIPRSAQTHAEALPAFAGEITVYYDRLNLASLFKSAKNVNGRNTQITLVGKPGKGNPSLAGKITADSIGVRGVPVAMGLYTEPSMELLCQQIVRESGSQPRCSLLLN